MRRIRTRRAIVGLAAIAGAAIGAAHAIAATETIISSPACCAYSKATFTLDPGQVATFENSGSVSHDVSATGKGPDGEALFLSEVIDSGQTPVNGTQYLDPGNYPFFCTIHPEMRAELAVSANGTPVARPKVVVKVLSSTLDQVVSSGKLRLRLTATTESDDVSVTVRKGARKIGSKGNLDLAAGAPRTVRVPLTSAGKNVLEDLESAKAKVTATVPFGAPATAKRNLN